MNLTYTELSIRRRILSIFALALQVIVGAMMELCRGISGWTCSGKTASPVAAYS